MTFLTATSAAFLILIGFAAFIWSFAYFIDNSDIEGSLWHLFVKLAVMVVDMIIVGLGISLIV